MLWRLHPYLAEYRYLHDYTLKSKKKNKQYTKEGGKFDETAMFQEEN